MYKFLYILNMHACDQTVILNLNEKHAFRTVKIEPNIDLLL